MKKLFCFIILFLIIGLSVKSQDIEITGIVLDEKGDFMRSASAYIGKKDIYEHTDSDGFFTINGAKGDTLIISEYGYDTQEIIIANQEFPLTITLVKYIPDFGIPTRQKIENKIHNFYLSTDFKSTSVLGYKFSFDNHKDGQPQVIKSRFQWFLYRFVNIGMEAIAFNRKMEAINPYLQFEFRAPKLDFGTDRIRLDIQPFINTGCIYSFSRKAIKPKLDFGSKLLKIRLRLDYSLEFFGNYSIISGAENAFFMGVNIGTYTTTYDNYPEFFDK